MGSARSTPRTARSSATCSRPAALHPLRLYLNAADRSLRVFTVPVAIHELMPGSAPSPIVCLETAPPPSVAPAVARSAAAMQAAPVESEHSLEEQLRAVTLVPPHVQIAEAMAASEVLKRSRRRPARRAGSTSRPPILRRFPRRRRWLPRPCRRPPARTSRPSSPRPCRPSRSSAARCSRRPRTTGAAGLPS